MTDIPDCLIRKISETETWLHQMEQLPPYCQAHSALAIQAKRIELSEMLGQLAEHARKAKRADPEVIPVNAILECQICGHRWPSTYTHYVHICAHSGVR